MPQRGTNLVQATVALHAAPRPAFPPPKAQPAQTKDDPIDPATQDRIQQFIRDGANLRTPSVPRAVTPIRPAEPPRIPRFDITNSGLPRAATPVPIPPAREIEEGVNALLGTAVIGSLIASRLRSDARERQAQQDAANNNGAAQQPARGSSPARAGFTTIPTEFEFETEAAARAQQSLRDIVGASEGQIGKKFANVIFDLVVLRGTGRVAKFVGENVFDAASLFGTLGAGEEAAIARILEAERLAREALAEVHSLGPTLPMQDADP